MYSPAQRFRPTDIVRGSLLLIPSDSKIRISDFIKISDVLAVETQCQPGVWTLEAKSVATLSDPTSNDEIAPDDAPEPEAKPGPSGTARDHGFTKSFPYVRIAPDIRWISHLIFSFYSSSYGTSFTSSIYPFSNPLFNMRFCEIIAQHYSWQFHSPVSKTGIMPTSFLFVLFVHSSGNTCFMNSTLQCLTHIPELEEYFLSGLYKQGLNYDNPLDMQGQITNVFGALIHHLYPSPNSSAEPATKSYRWGNSTNSYAPREFKHTLGKFAPAFSGYQQHDTRQFLGFLLDGLQT
ncbi:ubiquitin carboxyl-terminal hydrolase [Rhizoctonia solani]|uniref:ubiquitinyl hydrolase 1 n=1 Tax=Rhizoctonia solani TaxID=456999 RepID=A0A8H8T185_9AGAM|nr:ubiquitin carboxyl-terminal hydrolase [Rhizoctonia solani]QRW26186.1 ubiquitin carboxyl-terminal hydrolase [Rhizoctonia solani]